MKKLTDAQEVIYRFILNEQEKNGYPPTVREICSGVGLKSPASVHRYLRLLTEKGLLIGDPNKKRAYAVAGKANVGTESVPLLGKVAAGMPIGALENREDTYQIPSLLLHHNYRNDAFMLRVQGESMKDAGIRDGDIIVVEPNASPADGDIVVARIDREDVTVKRLFIKNNRIELRPENDAFSPMFFTADRIEILGSVTGLMRSY